MVRGREPEDADQHQVRGGFTGPLATARSITPSSIARGLLEHLRVPAVARAIPQEGVKRG
jgi:hypothetical protein